MNLRSLSHIPIQSTLTVAHLDHNPANNSDSNLAALCQACHNRYDGPKRAQNRKHNALRDAGQLRLFARE